jgi:hypothetical protein
MPSLSWRSGEMAGGCALCEETVSSGARAEPTCSLRRHPARSEAEPNLDARDPPLSSRGAFRPYCSTPDPSRLVSQRGVGGHDHPRQAPQQKPRFRTHRHRHPCAGHSFPGSGRVHVRSESERRRQPAQLGSSHGCWCGSPSGSAECPSATSWPGRARAATVLAWASSSGSLGWRLSWPSSSPSADATLAHRHNKQLRASRS